MAAVVNPTAGTRLEPMDAYQFVRGTTATFKITFMSNGVPIKVDTATVPEAQILEPRFLNKSGSPVPLTLAYLPGTLVAGQEFEYQFSWDIPLNTHPLSEYIISYSGIFGAFTYNFGDEFFTVTASAPGQISIKTPTFATVGDVRMAKFNIDDYLPPSARQDLTARNNIIEFHLRNATTKLREELSLFRQRTNTENFRLFCIYYTVYTLLLSSRGEDGSSVSDQNLSFWKSEWQQILAQEKRKGGAQGIPLGRG